LQDLQGATADRRPLFVQRSWRKLDASAGRSAVS
jgi:hypothetical protein